jgi:plasmid maintenance system antidote protein VapI
LEEIREAIKDKHPSGIIQKLLASELGISRKRLNRVLNGKIIKVT